MIQTDKAAEAAHALRVGVGLLVRRLKQRAEQGSLSMPEAEALTRLDREGPVTSAALARLEGITAQSMGATIAALESRGLVQRRRDPQDGRQTLISLTRSGRDQVLRRRDATTQTIARALSTGFTAAELDQLYAASALIERLAESLA